MIVRDEEHALPTCLAAAKPLSDDICIVDTGSSDRTVPIARALGARVIERAWQDDFALARNESLEMARRPWVLVLDADERISAAAVASIHQRVTDEAIGALSVSIHDAQPDGAIRISHVLRGWRRDDAVRFRHRIHEDVSWAVLPSLRQKQQRLVHIAEPIVHVGYLGAIRERKAKRQRDERLLWRCVSEDARDLYSWFKLLELGHHDKDVKLGHHAAGRIHALMRRARLAAIEHFLGDLSRYLDFEAQSRGVPAEQRLRWLRHWGQLAPDEPTLATLEGQLLEDQRDFEGAQKAFERALSGNPLRPNVQMHKVRPTLGLARLAVARGALGDGLALARKAQQLAPSDREARVAIAGLERLCG